jgi:UDP-glucose 4-epimerase
MALKQASAVLVTGGAGYIGSHTVRALAAAGERVIVLDSGVHGHPEAINFPGVEFILGRLDDVPLIEQLFRTSAITAVIHFAAYTAVGESVAEPLRYYQNNTAAPIALLDTMQRHSCRQFIFSSTAAVYGNPQRVPIDETHPLEPISPYGMSKLMLERILADCEPAWGLKSVRLRYFNASGSSLDGVIGEDHVPETHLIPRVLMAITGEIPEVTLFGTDYPTPDGTCIRDYIHVLDLASAHLRALEYLREGGASLACNLGTGRGCSVREIITLAEAISGSPVPVQYGPRRVGDPPVLVADPTLAQRVLGWQAAYPDPRTMVASAWSWLSGPRRGRYQSRP